MDDHRRRLRRGVCGWSALRDGAALDRGLEQRPALGENLSYRGAPATSLADRSVDADSSLVRHQHLDHAGDLRDRDLALEGKAASGPRDLALHRAARLMGVEPGVESDLRPGTARPVRATRLVRM